MQIAIMLVGSVLGWPSTGVLGGVVAGAIAGALVGLILALPSTVARVRESFFQDE